MTKADEDVTTDIKFKLKNAERYVLSVVTLIENLYKALEDHRRGRFNNFFHTLKHLYEKDEVWDNDEVDVFPSALEQAEESVSLVGGLLDQALEHPYLGELPDKGRAFAPANAHAWVCDLAHQIQFKFVQLKTTAQMVLDFLERCPAGVVAESYRRGETDRLWYDQDFPWILRSDDEAPDAKYMLDMAVLFQRGKPEMVRKPFLRFLESFQQPNFGTLRATLRKECSLAIRHQEVLALETNKRSRVTEEIFGLRVVWDKRIVSREGYDKELDLSSALRWHIFTRVLETAPRQVPLERLLDGYPNESNTSARAAAVNDTNKKLLDVGLKIKNRTLLPLD